MENQKLPVLIVGYPGDMAKRTLHAVDKSQDFKVVHASDESLRYALSRSSASLSGKDVNGVLSIPSSEHEPWINELKSKYPNLIAINYATAKGFDVNFLLAKNNIPFISAVTGHTRERESELVIAVQESQTCAVIDKNMNPALVIKGAMFRYAAENFPGALKGFTGYGIDSHKKGKKDAISGTLVNWAEDIKKLGVDFVPQNGDRTGVYHHGDHFLRITSPDGTTKLTDQTEVFGRESYITGTVDYALPFLVKAISSGKVGEVYNMEDVLKGIV